MKIFMIAGEDSGDSLGAGLVKSFKDLYGDQVECLGVGGPKMRNAGFNELLPLDQISVVGIWEVLPKIPRLITINNAIVEEIEKQQPDVVVTIDFPDFNFLIGKKLKKRGVFKGKHVHYVSPSVWAWRPARAKNIAQFLDGIICLFPMEPEHYSKHGLEACFVGHPIAYENMEHVNVNEFKRMNDIKQDAKVLGIFLGSREFELNNIAPVIRQAAEYVHQIFPEIVVLSPTLQKREFEVQKALTGMPMHTVISSNPLVKWDAFKSCDVAIAVSGTVALELAVAGVPHIIAYKLNSITGLILQFLVKVKRVHLVNILLDKDIVPEFLQRKCDAEGLAQQIIKMLKDPSIGLAQKEEFKNLYTVLRGNDDKMPSVRAAEFIVKIVQNVAEVQE